MLGLGWRRAFHTCAFCFHSPLILSQIHSMANSSFFSSHFHLFMISYFACIIAPFDLDLRYAALSFFFPILLLSFLHSSCLFVVSSIPAVSSFFSRSFLFLLLLLYRILIPNPQRNTSVKKSQPFRGTQS